MTIRTRFAPSPTGFLHLGGARTALFAWAYARHHQGQFILRIEDTDRERSTEASIQAILDGMAWLGLDYDEGPFYQTKRMARYQEVIEQLLEKELAYRCYCTKTRLAELRETQMAKQHKPRYDGTCRDKPKTPGDHPFVVRFKNPEDGEVRFVDQVRGEVVFQNKELDDLIIARTDGTPTYNFTVVVDDMDMEITHVIRGDDHINNTPRQINILNALRKAAPVYAHVPMILGDDGKRLSKRHGAVSVMQYAEDGFLPEAMLNYLVRLGWSHGDQEIFSKADITALFDLDSVNKAAAAFNTQKLLWFNQHYIKEADNARLTDLLRAQLIQLGVDPTAGPELKHIVDIQKSRCKTIKEMAEHSRFFYSDVENYDEKAVKHLKESALPVLTTLKEKLNPIASWQAEGLHEVVKDTAAQLDLKLGKVAQPLRVAITGAMVSPSIDVTLELIGKERVLKRIDKAMTYIKAAQGDG